MKPPENKDSSYFDGYAEKYDESLNKALAITGEDKYYYAAQRIQRVHEIFSRRGLSVGSILDFGCGTGTAAPFLCDILGAGRVMGVDPSGASIRVAQQHHRDPKLIFVESSEYSADGSFDAAYCNGVFHHIPKTERLAAAQCVFKSLRPGGLFAFWENNPWNPATVYVMSRCEFDRDAITLSPVEARGLLRRAGFQVVRTDYLFFFPKALAYFRPLEKHLHAVPLGGQYLVLGQKPLSPHPDRDAP